MPNFLLSFFDGQKAAHRIPGHQQVGAGGGRIEFHGEVLHWRVLFVNRHIEAVQVFFGIHVQPPGVEVIIEYEGPFVWIRITIKNITPFGDCFPLYGYRLVKLNFGGLIGTKPPFFALMHQGFFAAKDLPPFFLRTGIDYPGEELATIRPVHFQQREIDRKKTHVHRRLIYRYNLRDGVGTGRHGYGRTDHSRFLIGMRAGQQKENAQQERTASNGSCFHLAMKLKINRHTHEGFLPAGNQITATGHFFEPDAEMFFRKTECFNGNG
jgi:hypothetical protein